MGASLELGPFGCCGITQRSESQRSFVPLVDPMLYRGPESQRTEAESGPPPISAPWGSDILLWWHCQPLTVPDPEREFTKF